MMNIKLTIEYDGTNYHGWQVQPNGKTIQEVLEHALREILQEKVRLHGSGRTDAGVHALGQVANLVYSRDIDLWKLQKGLNGLTSRDIVVKKAEAVSDSFDARRDAQKRVYEYRIWNHPWPSVFDRRFAYHVHYPLKRSAMEEAIRVLEGEHDFSSFQASGCDAAHPIRRIYRNTIGVRDHLLVYRVEANAYLRHMVRNIVGTLIEVGREERSPADMAQLLMAKDRTQAGPTAPPQGLFLVEVEY
jgi:tRNA pseudouridine38-40 synthase